MAITRQKKYASQPTDGHRAQRARDSLNPQDWGRPPSVPRKGGFLHDVTIAIPASVASWSTGQRRATYRTGTLPVYPAGPPERCFEPTDR